MSPLTRWTTYLHARQSFKLISAVSSFLPACFAPSEETS